jgi:hypothetical protein
MFENIAGITEGTKLDEPKLKIAIVGEPKTGKSWLASTAPGPIFVADFDGRYESLRGKSGVFVKTYRDVNPSVPTALAALETDISMFEYNKSMGREIPTSYVLDSMTYMKTMCEHALIQQNKGFSRAVKIGPKTIDIAQGWDIINGNRGYMEYIIGRLSELGHVICVFHESDEKDNAASTKDTKAYTGRKTVQPQYLASILSLFNDVFRITIAYDGTRVVNVKPSSNFLASTSLLLKDAEQPPSIAKMLEEHKSATGGSTK